MRIVVDAGHGGADPGAVNEPLGIKEKDLNLQISIALQGWLEQDGHTVMLVRDNDVTVSLLSRTVFSNSRHPDCFLSIHCNAAENVEAHGLEVWTTPGVTRSDALADRIGESIQKTLLGRVFRRDESDGDLDKEGRLYVLVNTRCPAVLVECGFVSNHEEGEWLKQSESIQNIAQAIAEGVSAWAT